MVDEVVERCRQYLGGRFGEDFDLEKTEFSTVEGLRMVRFSDIDLFKSVGEEYSAGRIENRFGTLNYTLRTEIGGHKDQWIVTLNTRLTADFYNKYRDEVKID